MPGPLTDAEMAQMRAWFEAHQAEADEAAVSNEKSRDELASEVEMALIAVEKACDSMDEALA